MLKHIVIVRVNLSYIPTHLLSEIYIIRFPPLNQHQCVPTSVHILSSFQFIDRPLYHKKREMAENRQSVTYPAMFEMLGQHC